MLVTANLLNSKKKTDLTFKALDESAQNSHDSNLDASQPLIHFYIYYIKMWGNSIVFVFGMHAQLDAVCHVFMHIKIVAPGTIEAKYNRIYISLIGMIMINELDSNWINLDADSF